MLTGEALRGAIIASQFRELEGCVELPETQPSDTYIGQNTIVFLDGKHQHDCIYANAREGYITRQKATAREEKGSAITGSITIKKKEEEMIKGEVLILLCSKKVWELLHV